ncbi:hypothetical protein MMEU_3348 [Mycobacterium marinum str. Europe]|nr:hypothetical protein MMEU_3348 [Mycobacterium marinum str. Europe]
MGCPCARTRFASGCLAGHTARCVPAIRAARSASAAGRRPGRWGRTASPCRRPA